jgi:hypothetical protein
LHAKPHALDAHVGCACEGAEHDVPHAPQLVTLDFVSMQLEPQSVGALDGQPSLHVPDAQTGVAPLHEVLHEPHVAAFERSASHPSSALLEQCAKPCAHDDDGTAHFPALHVVAPLTCGSPVQSCAHAPQCFGSSSRASQPLLGS